MQRKPRKTSDRSARRAVARQDDKIADARERLFALEPGGAPDRPIEVVSASVVETHALSLECPRCGGPHELAEHVARTLPSGTRVREARLRCRQCGSRRSVWFRIVGEALQ